MDAAVTQSDLHPGVLEIVEIKAGAVGAAMIAAWRLDDLELIWSAPRRCDLGREIAPGVRKRRPRR